jgi:hypothetical protein
MSFVREDPSELRFSRCPAAWVTASALLLRLRFLVPCQVSPERCLLQGHMRRTTGVSPPEALETPTCRANEGSNQPSLQL